MECTRLPGSAALCAECCAGAGHVASANFYMMLLVLVLVLVLVLLALLLMLKRFLHQLLLLPPLLLPLLIKWQGNHHTYVDLRTG